MATYDQLPASAKRQFRPGTQVGISGVNTPAQAVPGKETWMCLMTDRTAFLTIVAGTLETVGGFSGAVIRRVPLRHPEYPGLLATGADGKGVGWNKDDVAPSHPNGFWKYYLVDVTFSSVTFPLSGQDAFLSISGNPATRQIAGPASNFLLNGLAPIFDPGDDVQGEDFTLTTHQLPTLPMGVYDGVRNHVNSAPFVMPSGVTRPVGTVLYHGPQYNRTSNVDGTFSYEVAHSFSYSGIPWSQYYQGGTLYTMYRPDGTTPKYLLADLTAVFSAG